MSVLDMPEEFKRSVDTASTLLKSEGCKAVYLFGSLVNGNINDDSDIDIGISGLPPERFFEVYSKLDSAIEKDVDLIDFDERSDLFNLLNSLGEVVQVG